MKFGGAGPPPVGRLYAHLISQGLPDKASLVFETMADKPKDHLPYSMGFKERIQSLIDEIGWDENDSYEGMHPPSHLAEDEGKPVESYGYFEVYIVFEAQVKVPFEQFVEHLRTTASYYLQNHPAEKAEVQKLMTAFEAHVATLQKNHDRWLAEQDQV